MAGLFLTNEAALSECGKAAREHARRVHVPKGRVAGEAMASESADSAPRVLVLKMQASRLCFHFPDLLRQSSMPLLIALAEHQWLWAHTTARACHAHAHTCTRPLLLTALCCTCTCTRPLLLTALRCTCTCTHSQQTMLGDPDTEPNFKTASTRRVHSAINKRQFAQCSNSVLPCSS